MGSQDAYRETHRLPEDQRRLRRCDWEIIRPIIDEELAGEDHTYVEFSAELPESSRLGRNHLPTAMARKCGKAPLCSEALRNLTRTKSSHRCKAFELRRPRASLALFPVVDGLPRDADQLTVACCGEAQL